MASLALLVLGVLCAESSVVAVVGPRRPDRLAYLWFLQSLLTGELACLHVVWETAVTAGLVALGALDQATGWIGLVLMIVAECGLIVAQWRQTRAAPVLDAALRAATAGAPGELPPAIGSIGRRRKRRLVRRRASTPPATGRVRLLGLLRPLHPPDHGVEAINDVAYGSHVRQRIDILRPRVLEGRAPVLIHMHGGSWTGGRRARQSRTLRTHFARSGWISISAGYRVSPEATLPDHVIDVKRVIAWVRAQADDLGADPSCIVLSGVSAGTHLSVLAALTPNEAAWQPGFEQADTSVSGCIAVSGIYDLLDRNGDHPGSKLVPFMTSVVMKSDPVTDRAAWDAASPIFRVNAAAPPIFAIHAAQDALVWREEARRFVDALRAVSQAPVAYAELPGAQHAFETFYSVRSAHTAMAAVRFGEWLRADPTTRAQRVAARARG
jgi:acetyl esterase/lipase